jgi:hypothetical protein
MLSGRWTVCRGFSWRTGNHSSCPFSSRVSFYMRDSFEPNVVRDDLSTIDGETTDRLRSEAMRIEEDATYTYMGHFSAARFWQSFGNWIGFPLAILSAVTAYAASVRPDIATATGVICTLLATSALYFRPAETAGQHNLSGEKYKSLRDRTRLFREVYLPHTSDSKGKIIERLEALHREKELVSETAIPLPDFAYRIGKNKIALGQSDYSIDRKKNQTLIGRK